MSFKNTVAVAQLVRVLVCGAEGRGFEPHQPPRVLKAVLKRTAFLFEMFWIKRKNTNHYNIITTKRNFKLF